MEQKKSLGVIVRFVDGHEEKYEDITWVEWDEAKGAVFIGRELETETVVKEYKSKLFSRKVTYINRVAVITKPDTVVQFKVELITGIVDFYE